MLLLSSKCTRLHRWEDTEKRFGYKLNRPVILFCSVVEYHSISAKRFVKTPSIWSRNFDVEYSLGMHCLWEEFGKEMLWSPTLRSWRVLTFQKSMLDNSMQKTI